MSTSKKRATKSSARTAAPSYIIGPIPDDIFGSADDLPEPKTPRARHITVNRKFTALVTNPAVYEAAAKAFPPKEDGEPGRPAHYPPYIYVLFDCCITLWRSARAAAAHLQDELWWEMLCDGVRAVLGDDEADGLPESGPRLHHWNHFLRTYAKPGIQKFRQVSRDLWVKQALDAGMLTGSKGTLVRPNCSDVIHGDVTVALPASSQKDPVSIDKRTGEMRPRRVDPDAVLTTQGGGELVYGNPFLGMSVRLPQTPHSRVILDVNMIRKKIKELDPENLAEGDAVLQMLGEILDRIESDATYVHDTAIRGKHRSPLIHRGAVVYTPQAQGLEPQPLCEFRDEKPGTKCRIPHEIYAADGRACEKITPVDGTTIIYQPLAVTALHRRKSKNKTRFYHQLEIPCPYGEVHELLIRVDETTEDAIPNSWGRKTFNRTEHIRLIPPGTPAGKRLIGFRQDAESVHSTWDRGNNDKRIPAYGAVAGLAIYIGYAWLYNSVNLRYSGAAE